VVGEGIGEKEMEELVPDSQNEVYEETKEADSRIQRQGEA